MSVSISVTGSIDFEAILAEEAEKLIVNIYNDLEAPPPLGTPVDTGAARLSWQIDNSNPLAPEVYSTSLYMNRLNDGHSKQSPPGWIDAIADKHLST